MSKKTKKNINVIAKSPRVKSIKLEKKVTELEELRSGSSYRRPDSLRKGKAMMDI